MSQQDLNLPCPPLIYPSRKDRWLVVSVILLASLLIVLGVRQQEMHSAFRWLAPTWFILAAFLLWPLYGTWYAIFPDHLLIRFAGVIRRIPLTQIERVVPRKNARLAPALSLDRLCVVYTVSAGKMAGVKREVLISPVEPERFLRDLRIVAPWIQQSEAGPEK